MTGQLQPLVNELRGALVMLEGFMEPRGVLDDAALRILWDNRPDNAHLAVAVVDSTGHLFRGRVHAIEPGGRLQVLADDGEMVSGISVGMLRAARIQDK